MRHFGHLRHFFWSAILLLRAMVAAANGQASSLFATLTVDYNPAYPAFWSNSTSTLSPTNYTVSSLQKLSALS